jgi:Gram-negative porin
MIQTYRRTTSAVVTSAAVVGSLLVARAVEAVEVGSANGWSASFDGNLNAHLIAASADTIGGVSSNAKETRITSGWNPTKFDAHFKAPQIDGLTVVGNFEFATNITDGAANGLGTGGPNKQNDVRVLEADVSGTFGTVAVGRGWGIFNSQAILNDGGSGIGVGALCGVPGGIGGGTCGRMGTGYSWTAFNSKIEYDTPDLSGLSVRVGVFDPAAVSAVGQPIAKSPRYEAEATYASKFAGGAYKVWVGGLEQSIDSLGNGPSTTMSGVDGGVHVDVGSLGLTGAYTRTKGFGNGNSTTLGAGAVKAGGIFCSATTCTAATANQWYAEADYTLGSATFGASTGQGKQDGDAAAGIADVKGTLTMAYVHYKLTPKFTVSLEYDAYKGELASATNTKYSFFSVGTWFNL